MGGDKNLSILLLLDPFPFFFSLILICGGYFRMQPNLNDSAISFTWAVVFQLRNCWTKPPSNGFSDVTYSPILHTQKFLQI